MSIIYKPRQMVSSIPGKEKTGYFAGKVSGGTIETDKLCSKISDRCTLTGSDVKAVIEALVEELSMELIYGRSVQIGDLGIFSASITSEVVDTKEALKPRKVRIKSITYLPSVRLKTKMEEAKFMRLRDFNKMTYGIDEE